MTQPRIEMTVHGLALLLCVAIGLLLVTQPLAAQVPPPPIPAAATGDHIDPVAATNAYLATMPADKKARSDAYFEGGYWLQLWGFLINAIILLALLHFGVSARIRIDRDSPHSTKTVSQTAIYAIAFALLMFRPVVAVVRVHRFHPRASIRTLDPDIRRMDGRHAQGARRDASWSFRSR